MYNYDLNKPEMNIKMGIEFLLLSWLSFVLVVVVVVVDCHCFIIYIELSTN